MLTSLLVKFNLEAATAVAQAAEPHARVIPAPLSQTFKFIFYSSIIYANETFALLGNILFSSIFFPTSFRSGNISLLKKNIA